MVVHQSESGFTLVEMIVALVIMSTFLTLLFQMFYATETQRILIARREAANDMSVTNLRKFPNKIALTAAIGSLPTCNSTNDLTVTPTPTGTSYPLSGSLAAYRETPAAPLPSSTVQTLYVLYPQGCGAPAVYPILLRSTVTIQGGETITHAAYIR